MVWARGVGKGDTFQFQPGSRCGDRFLAGIFYGATGGQQFQQPLGGAGSAKLLGAALGRTARELLQRSGVRRVVIAGGVRETRFVALRTLAEEIPMPWNWPVEVNYLEAKADERKGLGGISQEDWERLFGSLEGLGSRLDALEERQDFTEEVTRLHSHVAQFNKYLSEGGEVSKKLTYILQEIHREVNTLGSKANDNEISHRVVAMKEELERIREQVQNIE